MAVMSTQAINDLPDDAFAYIEPGGKKDEGGKTVPRDLRHFPIHDKEHVQNALARAPQSPFGAKAMPKIKAAAKKFGIDVNDDDGDETNSAEPPSRPLVKESLVRGLWPTELRANGGAMPVMNGHFAVWNQWTEINSAWEGRFMERLSPGAFSKTLKESRAKVLFQHGKDPQIGDKPLGVPEDLREDEDGVYYEVPLFDTTYNRDLIPGLESGAYGASFRFTVVKEDINKRPERSDWNPEGIPERTVQEVRLAEFGPVTFPAYAGASAGIRSLTDDYIMAQLLGDPEKLRHLIQQQIGSVPALEPTGAEVTHSEEPSRVPVRRTYDRETFLAILENKE